MLELSNEYVYIIVYHLMCMCELFNEYVCTTYMYCVSVYYLTVYHLMCMFVPSNNP